MQSLSSVCLHAHMFPCVQRKLSTTGVKESNSSCGNPQDLLPLLPLLFFLPSPLLSFTLFIISPLHRLPWRQLQKTLCSAVCVCVCVCECECICVCLREREMKREDENEKIKGERKECERQRMRAFDTVAAEGALNFCRHIRMCFCSRPIKNICIWFENNPYVAPPTYVLQIYISQTMYAYMWGRGGWVPFVLIQKDGCFYAFEHLAKVSHFLCIEQYGWWVDG